MNFKRNLVIILILTGILVLVGCSQLGLKESSKQAVEDLQVKPEVGFRAPDFTLTDLEGDQVSLSDFRGERIVFVNFWASWCPPCRAEMPYIQEIYEEGRDQVKVLAVNLKESEEKVNKFMQKNGYEFTALLDNDGEVANTYLVRGIPKTVVIDKNGVIKGKHVGSMNKEQMNKLINKAIQD